MAVFEFGPDCYIEVVWHVDTPDGDWMAALYRPTPAEPLEFRSRFRIYADTKVWGSQDRRISNRLRFQPGELPEGALAALDALARELAELCGSEVDRREVRGGFDAFVAALKDAPWMHMKQFDMPDDGSCPTCGAKGGKPVPRTRAGGEVFIGCESCAGRSVIEWRQLFYSRELERGKPRDVGWGIVVWNPDNTMTRTCKGCGASVTTGFDPLTGKVPTAKIMHAVGCAMWEAM